ncbi:YuzL family protein [Bacillus carboniphilus]|uniref:YuzL family protein n=1 Tax=Bacillus carboniphilus TaxID=86663 RepID=A0ABY9JPL0_9BACI|nr:YuzL family protein [Bacillus carboniphilus]WLR41344.1 YuzL family protein [Bacillus carboniphilus]
MTKRQKQPSKAAVSSSSVKGNAGPTNEMDGGGKKTSQNQQYGKENMGTE